MGGAGVGGRASAAPERRSGVGGAGVGGAGVGGAVVGVGGSGVGGMAVVGRRRLRRRRCRSTGGTGVGGSGVGGSGVGGSGTGGRHRRGSCASRFPLHASERLLVDACGVPFSVAGDSPQCLAATLSPANMNAYFAARAAQGFNSFWVDLLCTNDIGGRADSTTYDGIAPFTGTVSGGFYDLTKPNPAYFARIDAMLSAAAAQGVLVFADPIDFARLLANRPGELRRRRARHMASSWAPAIAGRATSSG